MSELIIRSGPNGVGKTTLAEAYAEHPGFPYLGADKIAAELCPEDPLKVRIEASSRFLHAVRDSITNRHSAAVETTLSGWTFTHTIKRARDAGFLITIVHLFFDSADVCVPRVRERVLKGEHDVPVEDIRSQFDRRACNFWNLYRPLADRWELPYNPGAGHRLFVYGVGSDVFVHDAELFQHFISLPPDKKPDHHS